MYDSSTRNCNDFKLFNSKRRYRHSNTIGISTTSDALILCNRIDIMNTRSIHFFMEVLVKKLHTSVDKYATLNNEGTAILYTTRDNPKDKQTISLAEGKRIFEDLYGDISERWLISYEYEQTCAKRKANRARRTTRNIAIQQGVA